MIQRSNIFCIVLAFLIDCSYSLSIQDATLKYANLSEDGRLQFCELATKYDLNCVRYNVTTEDGYILGLYNVPGDKNKPVFLMHGFLDSSDTFMIRAKNSLVANLANQGYDVWVGNMRGNKYSRAHKTLDPTNSAFWEFSFTEIGTYDVPAMIDFVLEKTGQSQIPAIAHSAGTTVFYVMGTERPEYNDKVKLVICLSPLAYLEDVQPFFPLRIPIAGKVLTTALGVIGRGHELLGNSSEIESFIKVICSQKTLSYEVCVKKVAFSFFGEDPEQFEPEFISVTTGHYPSGTSFKSAIHLAQFAERNEFAQYNYGFLGNLLRYKNMNPPKYDLSKITMNVALVVGKSDKLTSVKDVERLAKQLPNVVDVHVMEREEWNHIDFIWGNNMTELFVYLNSALKNQF